MLPRVTGAHRLARLPLVVLALAAPLAPLAATPASAAPFPPAASRAVLPPALPWSGKSRALIAPATDPWITPAERSGFTRTPRYDETIAWLRRLADASPVVEIVSLGKSGEGRDIWTAVVTKDGLAPYEPGHDPDPFSPEALRASGRPLVLVQAGIHAGEIDGKDAGLMLLREVAFGAKRDLLDRVNLLFVPILSVDGHERFSAYSRINQRGPAESGWRTNARNLNLNRDYTKADSPEMRAMIAALVLWDPDLYVDVHVTDGADYQYDVTFGWHGTYGYSPAIAAWLDAHLRPAVTRDLEAMGHVPGDLVFPVDELHLEKGCFLGNSPPRLSTGYGDLRHTPTVLVENHSLKTYEERVLGTLVFLESALAAVGAEGASLREATAADRARRDPDLPIAWRVPDATPAPRPFLGVASRVVPSAVSGGERVEWTGQPVTLDVPFLVASEESLTVSRPAAYWVPGVWTEVIDRLALHGIDMQRYNTEQRMEVEVYRVPDAAMEPEPYEGRARVRGTPVAERRRVRFPPGSVRVATDQPLGDLAVILLEPLSPDSFWRWGFFLETLQRSEYAEAYVLEPMAERMLAEDPALRAEFEKALAADTTLAKSPRARLDFFYRRTPYFDGAWRVYPVGREVTARQ